MRAAVRGGGPQRHKSGTASWRYSQNCREALAQGPFPSCAHLCWDHALAPQTARARGPWGAVGDGVAREPGSPHLHSNRPFSRRRSDRRRRRSVAADPGEDLYPLETRAMGRAHIDPRREPELDRTRQVLRSVALRLPVRTCRRWTALVHSRLRTGMQVWSDPGRAKILRVRGRAGPATDRADRGPTIGSPGGVPERSNGGPCKGAGSAFAGSNPASPIGHDQAPERGDPRANTKARSAATTHLAKGHLHELRIGCRVRRQAFR